MPKILNEPKFSSKVPDPSKYFQNLLTDGMCRDTSIYFVIGPSMQEFVKALHELERERLGYGGETRGYWTSALIERLSKALIAEQSGLESFNPDEIRRLDALLKRKIGSDVGERKDFPRIIYSMLDLRNRLRLTECRTLIETDGHVMAMSIEKKEAQYKLTFFDPNTIQGYVILYFNLDEIRGNPPMFSTKIEHILNMTQFFKEGEGLESDRLYEFTHYRNYKAVFSKNH